MVSYREKKGGRASKRLCLKDMSDLPGYVNPGVAAQVFIRAFAFKVQVSGVYVSFIIVVFYIVFDIFIVSHFITS